LLRPHPFIGIELMNMIRKGQMKDCGKGHTPAEQFYSLAA
jgi:hypothetical protein